MKNIILIALIALLFCTAFDTPTVTPDPCVLFSDPNGQPIGDETPEPPIPTPCPQNPTAVGVKSFTAKPEYPVWPVWVLVIFGAAMIRRRRV